MSSSIFLQTQKAFYFPLPNRSLCHKLIIFALPKLFLRARAIKDEEFSKSTYTHMLLHAKLKREKHTVVPATRKMALLRLPGNSRKETHHQ